MWAAFAGIVLFTLALDLGILRRKALEVSFREALGWSAAWVVLALLFNAGIWSTSGAQRGQEFLTGYIIEYALSIDNVFIFLVIFSSLGVPRALQHRVLFWGILGAVVLRAAMIGGGMALLTRFHWLIYIFGGFLILTGAKMLWSAEAEPHPDRSPLFQRFRRLVPSTEDFRGDAFFVREGGRMLATPLFLVLILIEFTDVVFALDSIPAILSVTSDPFIVFSSNVFAILGLRSLFFVLDGVMHRFEYLKVGLALTLIFVGGKMASSEVLHVPILASLSVVAILIGGSMAYSLIRTRGGPAASPDVPK
jgi:tellurite resistance protein TerC